MTAVADSIERPLLLQILRYVHRDHNYEGLLGTSSTSASAFTQLLSHEWSLARRGLL